jgi:hypothetical protein
MSADSCNITDHDFMNNPERVANSKQLTLGYKRGAGKVAAFAGHDVISAS